MSVTLPALLFEFCFEEPSLGHHWGCHTCCSAIAIIESCNLLSMQAKFPEGVFCAKCCSSDCKGVLDIDCAEAPTGH